VKEKAVLKEALGIRICEASKTSIGKESFNNEYEENYDRKVNSSSFISKLQFDFWVSIKLEITISILIITYEIPGYREPAGFIGYHVFKSPNARGISYRMDIVNSYYLMSNLKYARLGWTWELSLRISRLAKKIIFGEAVRNLIYPIGFWQRKAVDGSLEHGEIWLLFIHLSFAQAGAWGTPWAIRGLYLKVIFFQLSLDIFLEGCRFIPSNNLVYAFIEFCLWKQMEKNGLSRLSDLQ